MHGTTFGGGPLACAVAIEFLRAEQGLLGHVRQTGDYFHTALQGLDKQYASIQDVRGAGLMQAVELDSADLAKAVAKELLDQGIIINRTHDTVLRFLPPYIIQNKHVDELVKALDRALRGADQSKNQTQEIRIKTSKTSEQKENKPGKGQRGKVKVSRREGVHAHA
jgi:acetylornithine aminotransferase/acetylornithine/N-succinyldiaminopimelate aminotransferase